MGIMKSSGGGGEIVQVQGGHIVRATGRKDRHSKVFTAKGPRDRRVRLSAHTAIQFYDVQDRLGYDRPSKAVDWLIKKAKSAIDKLDELPPWHPNNAAAASRADPISEFDHFQIQTQLNGNPTAGSSSFMPPPPQPLHPDAVKSFFPASGEASSSMNFQTNPSDENLGLSLHSLPNDETLFENPFRGSFFSPAAEEGDALAGYRSALPQRIAGGLENLSAVHQQRIGHSLDGFSGFFVPAQVHGQDAHGVVFCRPSH